MEKREFWNKVNKAWVSKSDGIGAKIKISAEKVTEKSSEEIDRDIEELEKQKRQDLLDLADF